MADPILKGPLYTACLHSDSEALREITNQIRLDMQWIRSVSSEETTDSPEHWLYDLCHQDNIPNYLSCYLIKINYALPILLKIFNFSCTLYYSRSGHCS